MAGPGSRHIALAFGDFEIAVTMKKAQFSRDLKTEIVDADGHKRSGGGGGGGSARKPDTDAGESRAVRLSETNVIRLPQEDLDHIAAISALNFRDMRVLESIDYRDVATERIVGSYWLEPAQGTAVALRALAEALRAAGRVLVVKWAPAGASPREHLGVVRVRGRAGRMALLLSELTFANEFAEATDSALTINAVAPSQAQIDAAEKLIDGYARTPFEAPALERESDSAVDARLALYERLLMAQFEPDEGTAVEADGESSLDELEDHAVG
jgi:non-homologous end joining protein Ku